MSRSADAKPDFKGLLKAATGIEGLDRITNGGFPRGRPTLLCGNAGCGKTLLAMEFLFRGAVEFNEPGVFIAFEETAEDLELNAQSLKFDLKALMRQKKLVIDYIRVERTEISETGEYDLSGLFVRLGYAIDSIGAKRIVLDTLETLFAGLQNTAILRAELRRLFEWLKERGITAIITGERGEGEMTRHGLEEYVSDCVILLDNRVDNQISTRRLRVVKYRGSSHGANEYPFIIDDHGFSVLPISSMDLEHKVSKERISSGIPSLDDMMTGKGYFRGSTILVTGTAGTGKTSIASSFALSALKRGERCIYFAFEESRSQLFRNMQSIGIDFEPFLKKGVMQFQATRQTQWGLETHLTLMHRQILAFKPDIVILDPISDFHGIGNNAQVKAMLSRMIDFLKSHGITALLTSLISGSGSDQTSEVFISSLIDTWILLRDKEVNGERNRLLYLLKSRGMSHSKQVREFLLTNHGVELLQVYIGSEGVLMGSARTMQEARDELVVKARAEKVEQLERELLRKNELLDAQIQALRLAHAAEEEAIRREMIEEKFKEESGRTERAQMSVKRSENGR